jgi:hypothetical protein
VDQESNLLARRACPLPLVSTVLTASGPERTRTSDALLFREALYLTELQVLVLRAQHVLKIVVQKG